MSGTPRPTILLVDPDPQPFVLLLKTVAPVVTETTVEAALHAFTECRPWLTVLEYRLLEGSGLDLLAHIRLMDPPAPVVMATGAGSEAICARAFRLGVFEYFIKPIHPAQLLRTVSQLLEVKASTNGGTNGHSGNDPTERWSDGKLARIRHAARLIETQYDEPLSLERLATAVGMGKFELSREFTRAMGRSIRKYLGECRVTAARQLLASTRRPITEVAQLVGYGDLPRFDRVFRARVGCSPSAFRATARSDKSNARNF